MRACLQSRTAMRVLLELARFPAPSAEALYEGARTVAWDEWLTVRTTLAVEATVTSSRDHALRVRGAQGEGRGGRRAARQARARGPTSTRRTPTSGSCSTSRATRRRSRSTSPASRSTGAATARLPPIAPLKETLAAAILALGGVDPEAPVRRPDGRLRHARDRARAPRSTDRARPRARVRLPALADVPRRPAVGLGPDEGRGAREAILPRAPAPVLARDLHTKAIEAPAGTSSRPAWPATSRSSAPTRASLAPIARSGERLSIVDERRSALTGERPASCARPPRTRARACSRRSSPASTAASPRCSTGTPGGPRSCSPATRCSSSAIPLRAGGRSPALERAARGAPAEVPDSVRTGSSARTATATLTACA